MRKIKFIIPVVLVLLSVVSCDDFLGDNVNTNQATDATPALVLPNALTNTASLIRQYNSAGSWISGYTVNAGGFGGWGSIVTYNYTTNDHAGLWQNTYDDLNNYQYILNSTDGNQGQAYFNAAARTMKVFDFQMLVDFFGDVPYFNALQGAENVAPAYDAAEDIYQDMVAQLDIAIDVFQNATLANPMGSADVMFGGNVTRWAQFANTLKLKLLVRISGVSSLSAFTTSAFASWDATLGVLQDDALINPGYLPTDGKQNPMWATYHSNAAGAQAGAGRSAIPSTYILTFYNGNKIQDNFRGPRTYRSFPTTPRGPLGNLTQTQPFAITDYIAWYIGTGSGANAQNTTGLFKGRTAGMVAMLEAEAKFLLAEAQLKGFVAGGLLAAETSYYSGIESSFNYLYKDVNNALVGNPVNDAATYRTQNAGNDLVDFSAATTLAQQMEAIITQKYIALNFIHGHEAWNEFRRTGYPAIVPGSADPALTFASILSTSPRPDRLPVRVLYAATEYQLNESNVPNDVNQFTDLIFWQPQ
jgi:hypothetical protein